MLSSWRTPRRKSIGRVVLSPFVSVVVDCGRSALSGVVVCRATTTTTTTTMTTTTTSCVGDVRDADDVRRRDVVALDSVTPRHATACRRRRVVSAGARRTSSSKPAVLDDRRTQRGRASEAADVEFDRLQSGGCVEDAACETQLLWRQRRC